MILIKAEGHPRVVSQHSFQGGDPKTNCSRATEVSAAHRAQMQRALGPPRRSAHTPAGEATEGPKSPGSG